MRCPQQPGCGQSRFGVCSSLRDPRVRGPTAQQRRPCGFTPCEYDAVKLDMRTRRLRCHTLKTHRVNAAAKRAFAMSTTSSIARAETDRCNRSDHAHKRPVTSSATASLIRRSKPVMHRRVPLARCSATNSEPSRPGRTSGPSLGSFGGAPGVRGSLRRFAPAAGDRSSLIGRAHVPVRPSACPDWFSSGRSHRSTSMHDCNE